MINIRHNILTNSLYDIYRVWKHEFRMVFKDVGALIFFLFLPLVYPIIYALIYNPELVREVPVAVVDDCRSEVSREYTRELNASQYLRVAQIAANKQEAIRMMNNKQCYGIIHFPRDFSEKVGRGEQATVELDCDMSLLLRYKGLLMAMTAVSQNMGAHVQVDKINELAAASFIPDNGSATPIPYKCNAIGNTGMGLASALMPGIIMLIIHQSLVLAICLLSASSRERAMRNKGIDPTEIKTGVINSMIGKALCYFIVMIIPAIYIMHYVPIFFSFPQEGLPIDIITFFIPYVFAVIFFGMTLQVFVRDREATFLVIVFTSLFFVFLSGISWPRFAMGTFWTLVGDCIPGTWGMNGYVAMKTDGATLAQQRVPYLMLWLLSAVYFITSFVIIKYIQRPRLRRLAEAATASE